MSAFTIIPAIYALIGLILVIGCTMALPPRPTFVRCLAIILFWPLPIFAILGESLERYVSRPADSAVSWVVWRVSALERWFAGLRLPTIPNVWSPTV